MDKKAFTFIGLDWMDSEQIQKIRKDLLRVEQLTNAAITFKIELHEGVQLTIYDFDTVIKSGLDDRRVTFIKKYRHNDPDEGIDEDELLILTIDDDINIETKKLYFSGSIYDDSTGEVYFN